MREVASRSDDGGSYLLLLFQFGFGQPGCQIDGKHQHQQHCTNGPGGVEIAVLKGTEVEQHRQGGTVGGVGLEHAVGNDLGGTGGEEQRGAFG